MDFIPNTDEDRNAMLKDVGVEKISDLFDDIPNELLLKENLKIPKGLSEIENSPEKVLNAPSNTVVKRLDAVKAARELDLRF